MNKINFLNHNKDKTDTNYHICVIDKNDTIQSGWTNGRYYEEILNDFGEYKKDWFYKYSSAAEYLAKKKYNSFQQE